MPPRRLRFGLKVAQMGGTYAEIRDAWLEADRLGFDTAWAHDHLLNRNDHSKSEDEGWTILASLLTEAQRVRGGLMVTANTFRHPAVLAKIATTVGRGVPGGGSRWGWARAGTRTSTKQYGLPAACRSASGCCRLEEAWPDHAGALDPAARDGRGDPTTRCARPLHEPKPVQRPHPPIVLGTSGEKVGLRIVARHAQEWNMSKGTPAEFRRLSELVDAYCREAGRDPAAVERSIQFGADALQNGAAELVALSREFVGAGATHLIYTCPIPYSAAGARRLWAEVVTPLRG